MAKFEGTVEEFIKFIGGYSRNKVNSITRKYRKQIKKCECGSRTVKLDAAHIKGRERPIIINEILNNFIENGSVKIDLHEFENRFIEAHMPFENTIKILCRPCHTEYDRKNKIINLDIYDEKEGVDPEFIEKQEIELIEQLVKNTKMNKGNAIELVSRSLILEISSKNSVYSNQNSAKEVWWLEPVNDKFNNDFYMLLNKPNENKLLIFKIPKGEINPKALFKQRINKVSKIIIPIKDSKFIDENGFDFTPYLIKEQAY